MKSRLFFLLSGEHPTLPKAEFRAILESEGVKFRVLEDATQLLRVEVDPTCVDIILRRSALTRICCLEIFRCQADIGEILREARNASYEGLLGEKESFSVRVSRVRGASPHINGMTLERELGAIIPGKVVDLRNPSKEFLGILTDDLFVFGLKLGEIKPGVFVERRPCRRPFFHPTAMPAKLARCMVNLARPKPEMLILDPFCGTSSILIEAGLMGYRVMGMDVKRRMIRGSVKNLSRYGVDWEGLVVADALKNPVRQADRIVTDPPYGRSATTMGVAPNELLRGFLSFVPELLPRGGFVCLAAPSDVGLRDMGIEAGLRHVESHFIYIHRRLTREIAVFLVP